MTLVCVVGEANGRMMIPHFFLFYSYYYACMALRVFWPLCHHIVSLVGVGDGIGVVGVVWSGLVLVRSGKEGLVATILCCLCLTDRQYGVCLLRLSAVTYYTHCTVHYGITHTYTALSFFPLVLSFVKGESLSVTLLDAWSPLQGGG